MKIKVTKKSMKESYATIISVGYCNIQSLLSRKRPIAYSTRREGWACDYYDVDGVLISTGYAPLEGRGVIRPPYDLQRAYDLKGREVQTNYNLTSEERTAKLDELLHQFIASATAG